MKTNEWTPPPPRYQLWQAARYGFDRGRWTSQAQTGTAAEMAQLMARLQAQYPNDQFAVLPVATLTDQASYPVCHRRYYELTGDSVTLHTVAGALWAHGPDTEHDSDTLARVAELVPCPEWMASTEQEVEG